MFGLTPYNRKNNEIAGRDDFMDMRNIFDDFFGGLDFPSMFSSRNNMKADVRETEKEYVIEAEIPGVKKEDIKLDLRDDYLTIYVEQDEEISEERENYIRKERKYGSFGRSFYVDNIKNEGVTAKYDNGILTVTLPKSDKPKDKRKQIEIQ